MRDFGNVRKLPSGRWQASFRRDGKKVLAPSTFELKVQATDWLAQAQSDLSKGEWVEPHKMTLGEYAERWMSTRTLTESSRQKYQWLLDAYIVDLCGNALADVSPLMVREWYFGIEKRPTAAHAYRLLSAIYNTAVSDRLVQRSPCNIRGVQQETPERSIATVEEVEALAGAINPRLRLFVLLAVWCQLRRGELLGLRPEDVQHDKLTVRNTRVLSMHGAVIEKGPKTKASHRTIAIPPFLIPEIERHLQAFPGPYLFMGERGRPMGRSTLYRAFEAAREKVGISLTIHDLRHTGLTLAAMTGATTAELMKRAGHSSARTAMRYQHATMTRDEEVARRLHEMGSLPSQQTAELGKR